MRSLIFARPSNPLKGREVMAGIEDLFPWFRDLLAWVEANQWTWYYVGIAFYIFFWIVSLPLFFGYEWQLWPKPGLRKYRQKWNARTVSAMGLWTALFVVVMGVSAFIWIIPGIIAFWPLWFILLVLLPIVFGYPAIFATALSNFLGDIVLGWITVFALGGYIPNNMGPTWLGWKVFQRDPSLKTAKSWLYWFIACNIYAIFGSLLWCTSLALFGMYPVPGIFPARLAWDFFMAYILIWLQPPLLIVFKTINDRYKICRKEDVTYPEAKRM